MDKAIKAKWVAALRSGEYVQGRYRLRNENNQFCCAGVLCNLHAQAHPEIASTQPDPLEYLGAAGWPTLEVLSWAGLRVTGVSVLIDGNCESLAGHNDDGKTFAQIADAIEAQL